MWSTLNVIKSTGAAIDLTEAPSVYADHLALSAHKNPCVSKYSHRSDIFTRLHYNGPFARPLSHQICPCCCWPFKSCYLCVYRGSLNIALIVAYATISIRGFVVSETGIKPGLSCRDTQQKICYEAHCLLALATRTHYRPAINDSMNTVIECLSHFLVEAIQSKRLEWAEIQSKGGWNTKRKRLKGTKGRERIGEQDKTQGEGNKESDSNVQ